MQTNHFRMADKLHREGFVRYSKRMIESLLEGTVSKEDLLSIFRFSLITDDKDLFTKATVKYKNTPKSRPTKAKMRTLWSYTNGDFTEELGGIAAPPNEEHEILGLLLRGEQGEAETRLDDENISRSKLKRIVKYILIEGAELDRPDIFRFMKDNRYFAIFVSDAPALYNSFVRVAIDSGSVGVLQWLIDNELDLGWSYYSLSSLVELISRSRNKELFQRLWSRLAPTYKGAEFLEQLIKAGEYKYVLEKLTQTRIVPTERIIIHDMLRKRFTGPLAVALEMDNYDLSKNILILMKEKGYLDIAPGTRLSYIVLGKVPLLMKIADELGLTIEHGNIIE